VFENKLPRRVFGSKRGEGYEFGENCIMRSFINCTLYWVFEDIVGMWVIHEGCDVGGGGK
jgi:hypothetical protein